MFGFPSSIHASPSVAEERKEPKVASTNPSPNEKEQKQQAQDDKKATIKEIRQKAKKPLVRPPQFESSSSSKSLTCTIEEAHTGEVDNSSLPVMNGMVLPEVDMNALPQDQYFTFHFEDNESENENEKENDFNMKDTQSSNVQSTTVPRMKVDNSPLPILNGMVLPEVDMNALPQDQYFTFHFEDNESENESKKENDFNMKETQSSNVQSTTVPRMETNPSLPVMNGMVLPEVQMNALPQDQYFTFHFEDNESENESKKENGSNMKETQASHIQATTVPRMKVDNSPLPVMNGTTNSRMTGSVLPAVAPNPSLYPRPSIPLPNAPVIPTSVLPANQPSFHAPSVSPPSPSFSLSSANPTPLQPHTTQSDSLLQSTMSILDIPYPHVADQPELIESLPSEAPPMNTGVRFPDPPVINSVQQTPGVTLPGPISFKPSTTTTLQGNPVPTRDDLYVPISSCENGISW